MSVFIMNSYTDGKYDPVKIVASCWEEAYGIISKQEAKAEPTEEDLRSLYRVE